MVNRILVRLPNWLGDVVMASSFMDTLALAYPKAQIDVIIKKGLEFLMPYLPAAKHIFIFDKQALPGWRGAKKFGKQIAREHQYDLMFCLPTSLSAAAMAGATQAKYRIGFGRFWQKLWFTHTYNIPVGKHRVEEYVSLINKFAKTTLAPAQVRLAEATTGRRKGIIINVNSEAQSRRLPLQKAVSLITAIRQNTTQTITLIGAPKEAVFVSSIFEALPDKKHVHMLAGKTTMPQLITLLANAEVVLSTDSGPAHVANALGTKTLVLFGAGNERNTAPFNKQYVKVLRLGQLSCEPCTNNICKRYAEPQCLVLLDNYVIIEKLNSMILTI